MSSKFLKEKKKLDDSLNKLKNDASIILQQKTKKFLKIEDNTIKEAKKQLETLKKNKENDILNTSLKKCNYEKNKKEIEKELKNISTNYKRKKDDTLGKMAKINKSIESLNPKIEDLNKILNNLNIQKEKDMKIIEDKIYNTKKNCNTTLKNEIEKSKKEVEQRIQTGTINKQKQVKRKKFIKTATNILGSFI